MSRFGKVIILLFVSALILAAMVYIVGFEETMGTVKEAGATAFLAPGAVMLLFIVSHAGVLAALGRPIGHRVGMLTLMKAVTVGLATNIITPSTYLGGEPVKVLYLREKTKKPYSEITGTIVLAKYLEALSFILVLGLSIIAVVIGFGADLFRPPNLPLGIGLLVAAAAIVSSVVLCISLFRRWTPLTGLTGLAHRFWPKRRFIKRLCVRVRNMEYQVSHVFRKEVSAVLTAVCLFVLTNVMFFSKPLIFFFLGWHIGLKLSDLSLIFVASQVLLAGQLTPSAVGTLDGGLLAIVSLADIPITGPHCAAFLLCLRFWDAVAVAIGAILGTRMGIRIVEKNGEKEEKV
ncbi:MAG: lysylphosphatidylglycerol synthase transmembrane domain-containing protein [Kiritimatiellia bacterium]